MERSPHVVSQFLTFKLSSSFRFPSLHTWSYTCHFPIPPSLPRRIVSLQNAILTLIGLAESVTSLLAHPLHLPDLSDRFLELLHPWPVVLNVVFLDLLDVVIGLRTIHALSVLPCEITHQAKERDHNSHEIEGQGGEEMRDKACVFGRDIDLGCHRRIGSNKT